MDLNELLDSSHTGLHLICQDAHKGRQGGTIRRCDGAVQIAGIGMWGPHFTIETWQYCENQALINISLSG